MRTNADLGKFLLLLNPQTRPAILSLYNFIRNFTDHNLPLTPEIMKRFYLKALSFEHWQKNISELSQETHETLEKFLGTEIKNPLWSSLIRCDKLQIIKIQNKFDQLEVIKQYISQIQPQTQFRIFSDKGAMAHAVIIHPQGNVTVLSFDDTAYITEGQLTPLNLNRKIEYTKKLELSTQNTQMVQVSPFITAKFVSKNNIISGDLIRGYTFQNYRRIEIHELHQEPQLLYAVKRIERFFIDRSSEPLYLELIQVLEQTIDFLRKDLKGSLELAQKAYVRGKNALDNIFIDDKVLDVLLKDIQNLIENKGQTLWIPQTTKASFASTNSSLKPEYALEDLQIDL